MAGLSREGQLPLSAIVAFAVLPMAGVSAWMLRGNLDSETFEGVRLGMTAAQIRRTFLPGTWETSVNDDGTILMDWTPQSGDSSVNSVRFEVHQGLLVAIRADLRPDHPQADDPSDVTEDVLKHTAPTDHNSVQVLWIARNCPIHRQEVASLLGVH